MEEGGREVWLDDRMAAFTQRLVSPAETRLTRPSAAQPSPASSRAHEIHFNPRRRCPASSPRFLGRLVFAVL